MGTERRFSDRDEVRVAVACPKCGAELDWPCVGVRGRDRVSNHQARVDAAEEVLGDRAAWVVTRRREEARRGAREAADAM